jgi:hypothetical protein
MTDQQLLDELLELECAGWRSLCESTGDRFCGDLMTADAVMVLANGAAMDRGAVTAVRPLFDGDGLGQVARLVDVVAAGPGHRRGEHLQWHGGQQRLEKR